MSEETKLMELLDELEDAVLRENAINDLVALGTNNPEVVNALYLAQFRKEGEAHIAIYHVLSALGDQMAQSNGAEGIPDKIIKAMESGAKKSRQWVSDEVYNMSINFLTRWGFAIPPVMDQPIQICYICGKKITEERIQGCFLLSCENYVCREHAFVLKNPSGFDNWFCSKEHYQEAQHNPSHLM